MSIESLSDLPDPERIFHGAIMVPRLALLVMSGAYI